MDKVSVIVPVYNTKKEYLDECIDSILNQTYKEIEIIIIDDGSNEETALQCDYYAKKDNRIQVIHKKNEGVSVARNFGVEKATGKWIMFVDSDDWLEENAVELLVENSDGMEIIVTTIFIDEQPTETTRETGTLDKEEIKELISSMFLDNNVKFNFVATPWAKMYLKDFIKKNQLKMEKELKIGEDFVFNLEAYSKTNKISFVKNNLYHYRTNLGSVMRIYDSKIIEKYDSFYKIINNKFENMILENYKREYYYYAIKQINRFCTKYFFAEENKMENKEKYKELEQLVSKEPYKTALEIVNFKMLSLKQKLIVLSIKYKKYSILEKIYSVNSWLKK